MNNLASLGIVALAIKHVVELMKQLYNEQGLNKPLMISMLLGLVVAFTINVDFLELTGLQVNNHFVGVAITGFGFAGGSNALFDLLKPQVKEAE